MRWIRPSIIVLIAALMASCASVPHPSAVDLAAADYGEEPSNYMRLVHEYFATSLKDPSSVQYREITEPTKGYMTSGAPATGYKLTYGWLVNATINAKNSYGGYVGFRTYQFLLRGGLIVESITPQDE